MLIILGYLVAVIGGIWLLIEAFKESILWGLGCLFIPIVGLVFVIMHWDKAKTPFLIQIVGVVLVVVGGGFSSRHVSSLSPHRPAAMALPA